LVAQKTTKKFEVIVVDNNSSDQTSLKAENFKNSLSIRVIFEKQKGRGQARKTGFDAAMGSIIASTDADTLLPADWLEKITASLLESNGVAVTGTCQIVDCGPVNNQIFNFLQPFIMKVYRCLFGHYWLSGFNFAIYAKTYRESGGFNPKLNAQEDIDLSFRVSKLGKIIFINDMPIIFSGRRFRTGLVKGLFSYLTTFLEYYFLKKESVFLSDPR